MISYRKLPVCEYVFGVVRAGACHADHQIRIVLSYFEVLARHLHTQGTDTDNTVPGLLRASLNIRAAARIVARWTRSLKGMVPVQARIRWSSPAFADANIRDAAR